MIKPVVWLAVLCCLIPRGMPLSEDSTDCEIATSSVSITCGLLTFFTALGTISACAATAGAACGTLVAIGAVASLCGTSVGLQGCPSGDDMEEVIQLLETIREDIEDLSSDVDLNFYTAQYEGDIEDIRNAGRSYRDNVLNTIVDGRLTDSYFTNTWMEKMRTEYSMENSLYEIGDMIKGEEEGLNRKASIYDIAREYDLCSYSLYRYVESLIMEGTSLHFIFLHMETQEIPEDREESYQDMLLENERMYQLYCLNNVAIESFRIEISTRAYANTGGNLRIGVRQGENSCETVEETFVKPEEGEEMTEDNKAKFGSCRNKWFQPNFNKHPLEIRVLSDSGDDAYINRAAIKIGGVWREWVSVDVKVNKHGEGAEWRAVIDPVDPIDISNCLVSQSSTRSLGGEAERAIDGNTNGYFDNGSCTHTSTTSSGAQWWKVDLAADYKVFKVVIYNRMDCCEDRLIGAQVFALSGQAEKQCGETLTYNRDQYAVLEFDCDYVIADQIRVDLPDGMLTLCEVEVYGGGMPKYHRIDSDDMWASQSSTYSNELAARAIDGNTANRRSQNSCTHTEGSGYQWWKVDLGAYYKVHKVVIYNRMDCCEDRLDGAQVEASYGNNLVKLCGQIDYESRKGTYTIKCGDTIADRIRIIQHGQFLTLCEVEVYGEKVEE